MTVPTARPDGGEITFGGYIVPRAASDWPPNSWGRRRMRGGLFRKVMTLIGSGAKALQYFAFGPEYLYVGNCWCDVG